MRPVIELPPNNHNGFRRPNTPSAERSKGGLTKAVFKSTSKRFIYNSNRNNYNPYKVDPDQPCNPPPQTKTRPPLTKVDNRSEVVTGMTFARAMGVDRTKHKPKNAERHLFDPPLLDYPPYDWRSHDEKRRANLGFAIEKATRSSSDRFYGTAWRGAASLTPSNLTSNPTSYISTVKKLPTTNPATCMKSTAVARGSIDALRLGLFNVPKANGCVSKKLGPGYYEYDENAIHHKVYSSSMDLRVKVRKKPSSAFLHNGRSETGTGTFDVFAKANAYRRELKEMDTKIIKVARDKEAKLGGGSPSKETEIGGEEEGNQFDIYKYIEPVNSEVFLRTVKGDDNFADAMARWEKFGESEGDLSRKREIMDKVRHDYERNNSHFYLPLQHELDAAEAEAEAELERF